MSSNYPVKKQKYVYIITYGSQIELVSSTINGVYQYFEFYFPTFKDDLLKSYCQMSRDFNKNKFVSVSLPNRFPYIVNRYRLIKNFNKEVLL